MPSYMRPRCFIPAIIRNHDERRYKRRQGGLLSRLVGDIKKLFQGAK